MTQLIKNIFDQVCADVKVDQSLALKLHRLETGFVNKNKDHTEFFGGNLTGAHVVRFLDTDKNRWFDDIIDADEDDIREKLSTVPAIQNENGIFLVAGDPMNLSVIWLIYKINSNTSMSIQQRRTAMIDALLFMQFKFLTSRLYRHFKYPTTREIAEATYARLSNKFSIKQYGSWIALLYAWSEDVISNSSKYYDVISKMDDDNRIVRLINEIQGRIRNMLKNIYAVFLNVHQEGVKISTTSMVIEYDGVDIIKDRTKGPNVYTLYLKSVISDKNSFVRDELVRVIATVMPSADPRYIKASLEYISNNFYISPADNIDSLIDAIMIHSFTYLYENRAVVRSNVDLVGLLTRLRGVYTSSRSTDPDLLELRKNTEKIVRKAITTKTDSVIASVRTAVLLYIVARAYTMHHYSNH